MQKEKKINGRTIRVMEGDITEIEAEAIVNAANTRLQHGGGVALAISRKGGPTIQEESDRIGYCPVGGAVLTGAGRLKARYVIHTVGPRMGEGDEDAKLRKATLSCLKLADEKGIRSLAFPAVSAGIYGFPLDRCATIMLGETTKYLRGETKIALVIFCLFGEKAYSVFEKALDELKD